MSLSNKVKTRIFYTSIIVFLLGFVGYNKLCRYVVSINHSISNCFIDKVGIVGRERFVSIDYHFSVEGKVYRGGVSYSQLLMPYKNFKLLENKSFPIAYNKKFGHMLSYILIFPKDYKEFNVPYPDSLKWVLPLIKKY